MYVGQVLKSGVASLALASLSFTASAAGGGAPIAWRALKSLSLEDLAAVQVDTVVGASRHEEKFTEVREFIVEVLLSRTSTLCPSSTAQPSCSKSSSSAAAIGRRIDIHGSTAQRI